MFKYQSFKILLYAIPFVFITIIISGNNAFDYQLHDTYLVIGAKQIAIAFGLILAFLAGVYWLFRNHKLLTGLTFIHIVFTLLCIMGILLISILGNNYRASDSDLFSQMGNFLMIFGFVFILAQVLFLSNIGTALIRGKHQN